jgi:hypothetical protein
MIAAGIGLTGVKLCRAGLHLLLCFVMGAKNPRAGFSRP